MLQAPLISYLSTMANAKDSCPISFPRLAGRVDGLDQQGLLKGWCHSPESGSPIELEVWLAGVRLGAGVAREDRPDVASRGLAMRECGFAIPLDFEALPLDLLPSLKGERWRIVSTDHRYSLGRGDWRLTPEDRGMVMDHLLLRSLAEQDLSCMKTWLSRDADAAVVASARYRIVEWVATGAMAGTWDTAAVLQAHQAALANPALLQGVEADSCCRAELLLLALDQLQRCWAQKPGNAQEIPPLSQDSRDPGQRSEDLAHQLAERCYFGPTSRERQAWDSQLRPLFNVVIATLLLRDNPPDLASSQPLMKALVRLSQEVFGDLQLATTLTNLLDRSQPNGDAAALRLQLRSGDALGVAIAHFHQRQAGLSPSLTPFDQALALLEVSKQSLITIQAALERLIPLIPAQQARTPRSSFSRRLLDQLGWHVNTLSAGLIDQFIALGLPKQQGLSLRQRSVALLTQISQALWCGDDGHSGCTALPRSTAAPLRWLLIGERSLPQCWLYRVEQKRQQLERSGAEVRCIDRAELDAWSSSQQIAWADAVLFCRTPATYAVIRALTFARHIGKQVLADVDDLVFSTDFPAPYITYGGSISRAIHRRLGLDAPLQRWPLEQADAVITSTAALADACRGASAALADKPITVLPNLPLPELQGLAKRLEHQPPHRPQRLVVSSGTLAHKQIWTEQLAPAIAQLLGAHTDLRLSLIGHLELPACLQPFSCRISSVPYTDYGHYLQQLAEATIALVPLESHPTTHCKSAIKWMEASLLGLATICSPVRAYTDAATPDEHLLLADDQQAWVRQVERLLHDPDLLHRLSSQARDHAHACFNDPLGDQLWLAQLQPASNDNLPPAVRRQKLLVINVFFAPQSVGGATRVAQDQVREILHDHADAYDVTVLCIDHDPWQDLTGDTLPLDIWHWHGARIVRLAVPPRSWADIQDGRVESFCRQWFQDESFDLIHCHCCQVLTASPLVVARQLGIPYLITLHDGWWLSPELFLVSPAGRPIDPAKPFDHIDGVPTAEEKSVALERRSILFDLLRQASHRLAVSKSFRQVYGQAGVPNIETNENTYTPMALGKERPLRQPEESLRLCHVGGMASHKGYHILRQAAHILPADLRLTFTVIDHHLQEDDPPYTSTWNTYPVRFIPPVPMAEMANFYSSQDILVAPSIWPESFGLVTREAISAGLWVIASDIGALAEPIKDGINGNSLRPNDVEELAAAILDVHQRGINHDQISSQPISVAPTAPSGPPKSRITRFYKPSTTHKLLGEKLQSSRRRKARSADSRYRMVAWCAANAMAGHWDMGVVELAQQTTRNNPSQQQSSEAEGCSRAELLLLALGQLLQCWDSDRIHTILATPPSDLVNPSQRCQILADQLAERCYFGPSARERQCWDAQVRPLFNVVIATLLLQTDPPDVTPTRPILNSLVTLSQEVFGDLQLATTLTNLLDRSQPNGDAASLRLQLRSGDALGVAIAHFHQRQAGLSPSLTPFDQALALLEVSKQSLITIQAALERLIPLVPAQQARTPRSSFSRRLLDQLGWHVNTLSAGLIDQFIALGLPKQQGLSLRQRSVALLTQISQALWCGDDGHSGCTALPRSTAAPLRWLLIGERSLPQCWLYRVEQKRQQLERSGAEVRCIDRSELDAWSSSQQIAWADAVLFCRTPATYGVIRALTFARHIGKQVLADVDDLVFSTDFPAPYITYGGSISRAIHRRLGLDAPLQRWPLEQADAVITSTAALADACRGASAALADKPITVLPNLPLPELQGLAKRLEHQPPHRPQRLVVSSGTLAHKQIWTEQLAPAIAQLLAAHPDLRLSLIGHLELPACLQPFSCRISSVPYTDYGHYLQQLAEATIALVPLESHPTTHCKSAIKWMEASLLGLATICSPVRAYTDAATPDEHLLLADDQQAWVRQVERLLHDPDLLHRLSSQARDHAHACFNDPLGDQLWLAQLQPASNDNLPPAVRRQKLLVINVFFAPQSVGGATRVAQDQVREILHDHADAYDVTVLCIDHDPWQDLTGDTLPLDIWHWHGARIVRLAVPPRSWADIQDGRVESFCRQWFQDESFDLIHCHCCQVLTASPLVVARQLGIPYLITLHDGWWLSPELFLVSPAGRPIDPAKPFDHIDGVPTAEEKSVALERRSILSGILQGAQQRLAVSDPFRKVYEKAGISKVGVRENTFTPMPSQQPRTPRSPGSRVRICHIGGMAMHKGFQILRKAVHLLPPQLNLELTIIDHRLQEDDTSYSSSWNGYPIHFIPPIPMGKMANFYATQDALVAPSIWPESFGLVTREALSAGLCVVATNTGALSAGLEGNPDAFIINECNPRVLAQELANTLVKLPNIKLACKAVANQPAEVKEMTEQSQRLRLSN
ncbi:MAG: glycosyltransferase [Cyanobium sp. M30B3]|nr:MAG: glycosyltransferase [Cyanobium sp. M30B3]